MRPEDACTVLRKIMPAELTREKVRIPAANGTLAGELSYPFDCTSFAALMVNPHPHMGGRTGNRLMVRLAEVLAGEGGGKRLTEPARAPDTSPHTKPGNLQIVRAPDETRNSSSELASRCLGAVPPPGELRRAAQPLSVAHSRMPDTLVRHPGGGCGTRVRKQLGYPQGLEARPVSSLPRDSRDLVVSDGSARDLCRGLSGPVLTHGRSAQCGVWGSRRNAVRRAKPVVVERLNEAEYGYP